VIAQYGTTATPGDTAAALPSTPPGRQRVLTVPNLISFARLAGVPLFLWLFLFAHEDAWSVAVLAVGGTTDWVDGFLARRLGQVSRLGELLDPLADRLYILATLVALTIREVVPWWLAAALLVREAMLAACLPVLRHHGYGPPPVHYVGKTATFILLVAFPTLLLSHASGGAVGWAHPLGWALAWWGLVLYWVAGLLYVAQVARGVRAGRAGVACARTPRTGGPPPTGGPAWSPPPTIRGTPTRRPGARPTPGPGGAGAARPPGSSVPSRS
jgi:cardiolipin synthase